MSRDDPGDAAIRSLFSVLRRQAVVIADRVLLGAWREIDAREARERAPAPIRIVRSTLVETLNILSWFLGARAPGRDQDEEEER